MTFHIVISDVGDDEIMMIGLADLAFFVRVGSSGGMRDDMNQVVSNRTDSHYQKNVGMVEQLKKGAHLKKRLEVVERDWRALMIFGVFGFYLT